MNGSFFFVLYFCFIVLSKNKLLIYFFSQICFNMFKYAIFYDSVFKKRWLLIKKWTVHKFSELGIIKIILKYMSCSFFIWFKFETTGVSKKNESFINFSNQVLSSSSYFHSLILNLTEKDFTELSQAMEIVSHSNIHTVDDFHTINMSVLEPSHSLCKIRHLVKQKKIKSYVTY